jgi:uncharacterized cupredoxin-like copper-binding protein
MRARGRSRCAGARLAGVVWGKELVVVVGRKRSVLVVCGLGLMVWLLSAAVGPAAGQVKAHRAPAVTVISVTAGKPSELAFKLSKFSSLPKGTITFKVTNAGLAFHDFKLCTAPVASAAANACAGKVTKILKHGQSATLTVTLTKTGKYEFLCTVTGHAAAGMKGLVGIGTVVTQPAAGSSSSNASLGSQNSSGSSGKTGGTGTTGGSGVATGGGTTGGGECPPGTTIAQAAAGGGDHDDDDTGGPTDYDGCI